MPAIELSFRTFVVCPAWWRRLLRVSLLSAVALCAQSGDWAQVQALAPGARIEVKRFSAGPVLRGTVESVSADALAVQSRDQTVSLDRSEVRRVRIRSKGRTKSGRITGAVALGGLGILGVVVADGSAGGKAAGVGIFAGLGYLIGWAFDAPMRVTVYEAPKP